MAGSSVKITGVDAINRAFRELEPKLARKVIRSALRKGAKIVQAAEKQAAPQGETGILRKAIKVRASRVRKKNVISLGVIMGQGDFKGESFYGAFQNFGWKTGRRGSSNRTQIAGKHFAERALSETREQATQVISTEILAGIESLAKSNS
jgi:HK97 gp10 family phage protein